MVTAMASVRGLYVEIYFSGSNHYTRAGIVVRTTKINFHIVSCSSGETIRAVFGTMVDIKTMAFCTPLMGVEESVFCIE